MKNKLLVCAVAAGIGVAAFVLGSVPGSTPREASAVSCSAPADYSWKGTLPSYGIRDYAVTFCGDESMELYAGATWKGNKNISVALVSPSGKAHVFSGESPLGGELTGPLESGTWTIVVRNGSPSKASFSAALSFE